MSRKLWQAAENNDPDSSVWEWFHENSKTSRYDPPVKELEVRTKMADMWESLPYDGYVATPLPEPAALDAPIGEVIRRRASGRVMAPQPLTLEQLSAILTYSYGITRDMTASGFPRAFRVTPSGGALYPLELYFHTARVAGLDAGLYHFNPTENCVRLLRAGDEPRQLSRLLVQPQVSLDASVIVFVTAMFERSVFKYRDRGYRFTLLEAGHVAQNLNLVSTALGLSVLNVGGFFDRDVDDFLGIDGLNHSTVYMLAIGGPGDEGPASAGA